MEMSSLQELRSNESNPAHTHPRSVIPDVEPERRFLLATVQQTIEAIGTTLKLLENADGPQFLTKAKVTPDKRTLVKRQDQDHHQVLQISPATN